MHQILRKTTRSFKVLTVSLLVGVFLIGFSTRKNTCRSRLRKLKLDLSNTFPNHDDVFLYVLHIPKTGGTYLFRIANKLLMKTPEWQERKLADRPFLCDDNLKTYDQISAFPSGFKESSLIDGYKCTAHIFEGDYNTRADKIYTILRDPKAHVLSQYFHCKESSDHAYGHNAIPSLDEWLRFWNNETLNAVSWDDLEQRISHGLGHNFMCYIPVNMQSRKLHLHHSLLLGDEDAAIREIESRFVIIGDNSQMTKTSCSIVARYSDIMPVDCDCSSNQEERRRTSRLDHNVIHHGDTFEVTDQQREMIDNITKLDQLLYKYGQVIFARQVAKVEEDFGVKLCDSF